MVTFALVIATSAVVGPASATGGVWVNVEPDDVEHGDTEQSMAVLVEDVTESTEVVVNVTSLAEAGADLSNASVEVTEPPDASVDATIDRTDDDALIRLTLTADPDTAPTDVSFRMALTGLDTADAAHARLDYVVTYEDGRRHTQRFELRTPTSRG